MVGAAARGADRRPGAGSAGSGNCVGRAQGTAGDGHAMDVLTRGARTGPRAKAVTSPAALVFCGRCQ